MSRAKQAHPRLFSPKSNPGVLRCATSCFWVSPKSSALLMIVPHRTIVNTSLSIAYNIIESKAVNSTTLKEGLRFLDRNNRVIIATYPDRAPDNAKPIVMLDQHPATGLSLQYFSLTAASLKVERLLQNSFMLFAESALVKRRRRRAIYSPGEET